MTENQEQKTEIKHPPRKWARWMFLSIFVLIAIPFSFISVRREVCRLTGGLCYFTCTHFEITEMGCALGEHEVRARFFARLLGLEKKIDITKGTVITKDGIYKDGVLVKPYQPKPVKEKMEKKDDKL